MSALAVLALAERCTANPAVKVVMGNQYPAILHPIASAMLWRTSNRREQ
jgi:hypothetical protein